MSATSVLRQRTDRPHELTRKDRTGGDHDPQPSTVRVVQTVDARIVRLPMPRVEPRHDQRGDSLTVVRTDRIDVDDARDDDLSRARNGTLPSTRRAGKLVERRRGDAVFLADSFRRQSAVADEFADGFRSFRVA